MLFNLDKDPTQQCNIIDRESELANELYQKFIDYLHKIQAPSEQIKKYVPYWNWRSYETEIPFAMLRVNKQPRRIIDWMIFSARLR